MDSEGAGSIQIDDSESLSNDVENARFSLHAAVDARKSAERDAQLLMNRINLLKHEEIKALKNIEVTRTKAKTLANVRQDALQRQYNKQKAEASLETRASLGQDRNQYMREVSKITRAQIRKQVEEKNARLALDTRLELQRRVEEKLDVERAERERIQRRTEVIRQDRLEAKKRIEAERVERLKSFRTEYENRLRSEVQRKQESEAVISKLEAEENELIERLRRAQAMQNQIYTDLNRVIPVTPIVSTSSSAASSSSKARKHAPIVSPIGKWDIGGAALR